MDKSRENNNQNNYIENHKTFYNIFKVTKKWDI